MSEPVVHLAIRPIALSKPQAAAALGMSVDSFERYAQPELRCIYRGRLRLFPVTDLERWANANAEHSTTSRPEAA